MNTLYVALRITPKPTSEATHKANHVAINLIAGTAYSLV